jgi:hypothetical protein
MPNVTGTKENEATAAIQFALKQDQDFNGMEFLRLWNEGQFHAICRDWPEWAEIVAAQPAPAPDAVAVPKEMIEMVIGRIDHVHNWLAGWQHFEQCDHLLLARKALDRAWSAAQRNPAAPRDGR